MSAFIRKESGLWLCAGTQFGGHGDQFLRMNVAGAQTQLYDGLSRLKKGILLYENWLAGQCYVFLLSYIESRE